MKTLYTCIGVLSLLSLALVASVCAQDDKDAISPRTTTAQPTIQNNPSAETASTLQGVLLSSDTIIGASVKNQQGEDVGSIERLMLSPQTGLVSYAVLSVGGFLGVGEKSIMVPWRTLEIARDGDSLLIKTSKQLLQQAPESTLTPDKDKQS
jgi:sporulation protein YlmC with PRC-barrel domain